MSLLAIASIVRSLVPFLFFPWRRANSSQFSCGSEHCRVEFISLALFSLLKQDSVSKKGRSYPFVLLLFCIAIFGYPYYKIVDKVYHHGHNEWEMEKLRFRDFMEINSSIKDYTIVTATYNSHSTFYKKQYNLKGYDIKSHPLVDFKRNISSLS